MYLQYLDNAEENWITRHRSNHMKC